MLRHLRLRHDPRGDENSYKCEVDTCGKTFKRQDARLKHWRKQHPEKRIAAAVPRKTPEFQEERYTCEVESCDKEFRRTDARLRHREKQHPELWISDGLPSKHNK